jgi:creatinine amidohydrolase
MRAGPVGYWQDLTTEDFAEVDGDRSVALLPVAAIEQHGPHLPLYTDACIGAGLVAEMWRHLDDDVSLLVLPPVSVGTSREHMAYPGTLSVTTETLTRYLTDIGDSVAAAGLRKLILMNAHGGQTHVLDAVALDLRARHGMLAVKATYFGFGVPADLVDDEELDHGIHGGQVETAMMLHLRPDLVRLDAVDRFEPLSLSMMSDYRYLKPEGAVGFGWLAQDLHPSGAVGDAARADAATGARVVAHAARCLAGLAAETARFPLAALRGGPEA